MRIRHAAAFLMLSSIAVGAGPSKSDLDGDPVSGGASVRQNAQPAKAPPGDDVGTRTWLPSLAHGLGFAVVGRVEWDGDGYSDWTKLQRLVHGSGGRIDLRVDDDGNRFGGGMNERTKFLIVAEIPNPETAAAEKERDAAARINGQFAEVSREARKLGVRMIQLADFFAWVGFVPQAADDPVEGTVLSTGKDEQFEYVTVSLGGRNGLLPGDRLPVYRSGEQDDARATYLGKIEIHSLTQDRAVGKTIEKAKDSVIRQGDRVVRKIENERADSGRNARLEGHVLNARKVSTGTEWVEIFLGADDGVSKDDLIFLSRPDGLRLGGLKYLGSIRITLLTPDRAVGRTVDKVEGVAFRRGDRADTKKPQEDAVGVTSKDLDGLVYWVDDDRKTAWIGLGTVDGLDVRTMFDVLPLPVPKEGQLADHVNGMIEVTRLLGPHLAEARILSESRPVKTGDLLINAEWSPTIPCDGVFQIVAADGTRYQLYREGPVEISRHKERIGLVTRHESRTAEIELPRPVVTDDDLVLGYLEKQQNRAPHRGHVLHVEGDWTKSLSLRAVDESVYQVSTLAGRPVRVQPRENRLLLVVDLPRGEPFQWNSELVSRRTETNRTRLLSEEQRPTRPDGGYRSGQTGSLGGQSELTVIEVFCELKQIDSRDRPARARRPD